MKPEKDLLTFSEMAYLKMNCRNTVLKELRFTFLLGTLFDANIQHENKSIFCFCEIRMVINSTLLFET
jgi:hypothetical protein